MTNSAAISWLDKNTGLAASEAAKWVRGELRVDARRLGAGDVFVALPGGRRHGDEHVDQAAARGAVGVLSNRPSPATHLPIAVVTDLPTRLDELARVWYPLDEARLRIAAVTGTNGKTSVTHMVEAMAAVAGLPAAVVGTVEYRGPGHVEPARETTPHRIEIQRLLARWQPSGGTWLLALEASSHALDQQRLGDLRVSVAAVTNLSQDHLDYHGDEASYRAAKARLFAQPAEGGAGWAVVPVGDDGFREAAAASGRNVLTFGRDTAADVRVEILAAGPVSTHLRLIFADGTYEVEIAAAGEFQADNAACAAAVGRALGWPSSVAARGLQGWRAAPGRLECVRHHPLAFVDYAHTPDALNRTLRTARRFVGESGRLIVVFGAGGNRDRGKREPMGRVAGELADVVVLTSDNSRDEDPADIASAIAAGVPPQTPILTELDRGRAIRQALAMAGPADVVVVAGKGHETVQEIRGARLPFDDREEIRTWGIQ